MRYDPEVITGPDGKTCGDCEHCPGGAFCDCDGADTDNDQPACWRFEGWGED